MKFLTYTLFLFYLSLSAVQATEIYQWLDAEGVKQFSNNPPPGSCQTHSCVKIKLKTNQKYRRKKQANNARLEVQQLKQEEMEQKRKQQRTSENPSATKDISERTFLPLSTVICINYNSIKEYIQVSQARKYLERERVCTHTIKETEYTIIERKDDFSNIRIYLDNGESDKKWVESRYVFEGD